jgi:hypothetical protein
MAKGAVLDASPVTMAVESSAGESGADLVGGSAFDEANLTQWFANESSRAAGEQTSYGSGESSEITESPDVVETNDIAPETNDISTETTEPDVAATATETATSTLTTEQQQLLELAQKFEPILKSLQERGIGDAAAVDAKLAEQAQQAEMQQTAQKLYQEYDAQVQAGTLTPELAERLFLDRLDGVKVQMEAQRIVMQNQAQMQQALMSQALAAYPELKGAESLLRATATANKSDFPTAAKQLSEFVKGVESRALAAAAAKQAQAQAKPQPMAPGKPVVNQSPADTGDSFSWVKYFGIKA